MNPYPLIPSSSIAADLSFFERWTASARVILTGFVVVFGMLLLLIGIIKLYSFLVMRVQDKTSIKAQKKVKVAQPSDSLKKSSLSSAPAVPAVEEGISEEVVAVIAAAVAAAYGSKSRVKIKSIRKSGGRNAWANAGILENTRPF